MCGVWQPPSNFYKYARLFILVTGGKISARHEKKTPPLHHGLPQVFSKVWTKIPNMTKLEVKKTHCYLFIMNHLKNNCNILLVSQTHKIVPHMSVLVFGSKFDTTPNLEAGCLQAWCRWGRGSRTCGSGWETLLTVMVLTWTSRGECEADTEYILCTIILN